MKNKENIFKNVKCHNIGACYRCDYKTYGNNCLYELLNDCIHILFEQEKEINDLKEDIKDWEKREDKLYEEAHASLMANIRDGGTSCHWCMEDIKENALKKVWDKLQHYVYRYPNSFDTSIYIKSEDMVKMLEEIKNE